MVKPWIRWVILGAAFTITGCGSSQGPATLPATVIQSPTAPSAQPAAATIPPVAKLFVQIDKAGSTAAIQGYSPIFFDATASQGDHLTYEIDFGDGSTSSGPESAITHPCRIAGLLTSRLTVRDDLGRASTAIARFPCVNLVNTIVYGWTNSIQNLQSKRYEFRRLSFESQAGSTVRGYYTHPEGNASHFSGSLSGDRTITLTLDEGTITFTGDVLLNDQYSETSYFESRYLRLLVKGGSADGQTLIFNQYNPF
jgi:hypothetical protein